MMNNDRGRWHLDTHQSRQTTLGRQIVLGHLLPHYQAAMDRQETVWIEHTRQNLVDRSGQRRLSEWIEALAVHGSRLLGHLRRRHDAEQAAAMG
jgi:hypothetical protein